MQNLSFTTTAMSRPSILKRTYESFTKNLTGVDLSDIRLFINVDPLPVDVDRQEVIRIAENFFPNVVTRLPSSPSFSSALNWLWTAVDTEYIFHLEDDWLLTERVSVPDLIARFIKTPTLYQVVLRAYSYRYRKLVLSPSLIHKRLFGLVGGNFIVGKNPECQLREARFGLDTEMSSNLLSVYSSVPVVKDIGREWIEKTEYRRHPVKYSFDRWEKL